MLKRIVVAVLLLAAASSSAPAWIRGSTPPGKAQLNIGNTAQSGQMTINAWHSASINYTSGATPAALDADMMPVRNFSGLIDGQISPGTNLSTTGPWVLGWDAGRGCIDLQFLKSGVVSNVSSGITVTNGAGSGNLEVVGTCGQAGSLTINWNDTTSPTYRFLGTYTLWGGNTSGRIYMVRQSDLAKYNSGTFWTDEAVALISNLRPESLRFMGWNVLTNNQNFTNVVNWSYRKQITSLSFFETEFPPGTRCGGVSSFCTISVAANQATAAPAADTSLAGWVDGEQLSGELGSSITPMSITSVGNNGGNCQITVASTADLSPSMPVSTFNIGGATECTVQATTILTVDSATQFTINVAKTGTTYTSGGQVAYQTLTITGKSGGSKLIWSKFGTPLSLTASGNVSFTYNATLDRVLISQGSSGAGIGITNAPPLEAQIQLANLARSNFWYNVPPWANDNFVTNAANLIYTNLTSNLISIWEYGNEFFNFGQAQAQWSTQMGWMLGITTTSPTPFQSLRIRQIFGNLLPASSWAAAMSRLDRTYCVQTVIDAATAVSQMQGSALVSPGSAKYQTFVGGSAVNYNTYPNRPVDFTNNFCMNYYIGGGSAFSGQSVDTNVAPTSFDVSLLNSVVTAQNASDTATVTSLIDGSIRGDILNRTQTVTAVTTTFTTPLAHNLSVNDAVRFTASGGTPYSSIDLLSTYQVLTTPTSTTFTAGKAVNGVISSAVNAGSAGTGTMSVGYVQPGGSFAAAFYNATIFGYQTTIGKFQNMVTSGFSPAPALGTLGIRVYEGNIVPTAPSSAQCTSLSISAPDCATLATAVMTWRNSTQARTTTDFFFKVFKGLAAGQLTTGAVPNAKSPSWLTLQKGPSSTNEYSLNSNNSYVAPSLYQTYYGFSNFSSNQLNFLLKRDIDPASNDNDPMWLEKAS